MVALNEQFTPKNPEPGPKNRVGNFFGENTKSRRANRLSGDLLGTGYLYCYVLAGVNGSGKSSIGGAAIVARGVHYDNPDTAAQELRQIHPNMTQVIANSHAWALGRDMLVNAIERKESFAFETTLGGNTITSLLIQAAEDGLRVKLWYAGLESVELNLARVQARVANGGHDIPEADIRKRWDSSRRNLIKLLPYLDSLRLYDNSKEADPCQGIAPRPELLLHIEAGKIVGPKNLKGAPEWAKPIVAGAFAFTA